MTPKEKAKESLNVYKKQVSMIVKDYSLVCKVLDNDMAKQCALIAVDEILRVIYRDNNYQNIYAYFLEVKQEIEKL